MKNPKIISLLGILGFCIAYCGISISILLSPWFNWYSNALSDLGVPSNPAAPVFNGSLILSGLILSFFGLSLLIHEIENRRIIGTIGFVLFFISAIALMGIGLFNETIHFYHALSTLFFFLTLMLSSVVYGLQLILKRSTRLTGSFFIVCGLTDIIILLGFLLGFIAPLISPIITGEAIPEIVLVFFGQLWIIITSIRAYLKNSFA